MNLLIGLCFGMIAAVALVVMWRMAARLRDEAESRDDRPFDEASPRGETLRDSRGER